MFYKENNFCLFRPARFDGDYCYCDKGYCYEVEYSAKGVAYVVDFYGQKHIIV